MLTYLLGSVLTAIIFTALSMMSYHISLKSQISKDTTFEASGSIIVAEIRTFIEMFFIYLASALIVTKLVSPFSAFILLIIEFILFWIILHIDIHVVLNNRWNNH